MCNETAAGILLAKFKDSVCQFVAQGNLHQSFIVFFQHPPISRRVSGWPLALLGALELGSLRAYEPWHIAFDGVWMRPD